LWAIASVLYGRLGERIPPLQLNLIKGIVAIALLLLTIVLGGEEFPVICPLALFLLVCSGVTGIGLGDTAFFATINILGARRALLLGMLAPPLAAIAAMVFLQEQLNVNAWCGILLTVVGVAWVVTERTPNSSTLETGTLGEGASPHLWRGIGLGLVTAITNALGTIFSRAAFAYTDISPLWAALWRLSAGVLILPMWMFLDRSRNTITLLWKWKSAPLIFTIFFAAFCGTYLGIWLQQIALKYTTAGIASTLLQTSPVFATAIAIYLGEEVTCRAIVGVVMAIAGIVLLFNFQ
jgi:drug/metabolite transporter (DMT)-like permease